MRNYQIYYSSLGLETDYPVVEINFPTNGNKYCYAYKLFEIYFLTSGDNGSCIDGITYISSITYKIQNLK